MSDERTPEEIAEAERQENLALSRAEKAEAIAARGGSETGGNAS